MHLSKLHLLGSQLQVHMHTGQPADELQALRSMQLRHGGHPHHRGNLDEDAVCGENEKEQLSKYTCQTTYTSLTEQDVHLNFSCH